MAAAWAKVIPAPRPGAGADRLPGGLRRRVRQLRAAADGRDRAPLAPGRDRARDERVRVRAGRGHDRRADRARRVLPVGRRRSRARPRRGAGPAAAGLQDAARRAVPDARAARARAPRPPRGSRACAGSARRGCPRGRCRTGGTAPPAPLVYVSFGSSAAGNGFFPDVYREAAAALGELPGARPADARDRGRPRRPRSGARQRARRAVGPAGRGDGARVGDGRARRLGLDAGGDGRRHAARGPAAVRRPARERRPRSPSSARACGSTGRAQLADAIFELLDDPFYRANARSVAAEIEALPPVDEAVMVFEALGGRERGAGRITAADEPAGASRAPASCAPARKRWSQTAKMVSGPSTGEQAGQMDAASAPRQRVLTGQPSGVCGEPAR